MSLFSGTTLYLLTVSKHKSAKDTINFKLFLTKPTSSSEEEEAEQVYEGISQAIRTEKAQFLIPTGSINAKLQQKTQEETEQETLEWKIEMTEKTYIASTHFSKNQYIISGPRNS